MISFQAIPIVTLALMPCAVNCAPEGAALGPSEDRALYDMETITFEEMEPDKPAIVESEVFNDI